MQISYPWVLVRNFLSFLLHPILNTLITISTTPHNKNESKTMISVLIIFLGTVLVNGAAVRKRPEPPDHYRLTEYLLDKKRFNPTVRPVNNSSHAIELYMRMNLYQLLEVNEPQQQIMLYAWTTQYWDDYFLGWDPAEFGNLSQIVIPHEKVWIPDTVLYNCVEMTRAESERWISVIYNTDRDHLNETGVTRAKATFQYPAIYKFTCKMNIFLFPFDDQNCTMTFSSWVYDSSGINYNASKPNVSFESYVENEEWKVISFQWQREVIVFRISYSFLSLMFAVYYKCCPYPWTLLHVHLVIGRKALYYVANLVLPTGIITFIAIVGFFTPASTTGERTEKVNLGITTLLAMSILLLMVNDQMPTTSNFIPLMGWFFLLIIIMISLGTVTTAGIIMLHQQHLYGRRVPKWLREPFFFYIGPVLFCRPSQELVNLLKKEKGGSKGKGGGSSSAASHHNDGGGGGKASNNNKVTVPKIRLSSIDREDEEGLTLETTDDKQHHHSHSHNKSKKFRNGSANSYNFEDTRIEEKETPNMSLNLLMEIQESLENLHIQMEKGSFVGGGGSGAGGRHRGICEMEWAHLANVFDRIFLILFVSFCLALTGGIVFVPRFLK